MNIDRPHSPNSPDRIAAFGGLPADHAVQTKNVDGFRSPLVSVVIPTRNRPARLCECLLALFAQSFDPDDFEIIVVDDGSQPPIRLSEILTSSVVAAKKLPTVRLIRQDCQGPAMARNQGAFKARGTLLAFTDDDCRPLSTWLETLVAGHSQFPVALIGGVTLNGLPSELFAETSHLILEMVYEHFNSCPENCVFLASNNWLCETQKFLELGGFDSAFRRAGGEDRDFCNRWRSVGLRIVCLRDAGIQHFHRQSLRGFWNMHYRYGFGAALFHAKRAQRQSGNSGDDIGFHFKILRRLPAFLRRYGSSWRKAQIVAALILWEIANAVGFAFAALQRISGRIPGARKLR